MSTDYRHTRFGPAHRNARDATSHAAPEPAIRPLPIDMDARITHIASFQYGVVTRRQLIDAGVAAHRIDYRLRQGRLRRIYPTIYRTGAVVSSYQPAMAAILACGRGAVLGHDSAGVLWSLRPGAPVDGVDVFTRTRCRPPGPGVRLHRNATLFDDEVTECDALPVTTPARTLLDLAAVLDARELERAVALAERYHQVDCREVAKLLDRHAGVRGARALRALVGDGAPPALTRSEAESRFLTLIRKSRLPAPETNVVVQGYEVDFLWRRERLIAEIDGFAFHSSRDAFERDRRRDAMLAAAGFRVVRVTWRQLTTGQEAVLVALAQALAMRQVV